MKPAGDMVNGSTRPQRGGRWALLWLGAALALVGAGCGVPVRVSHADPRTVHKELTGNVLSSGDPSSATLNVLYHWDLYDEFDDDPKAALAQLYQVVIDGRGTPNDLFALAELSFLYAEQSGERSYYLAAAVEAWAYVFPHGAAEPPSLYDPRARVACDLYNRALTRAFDRDEDNEVELRAGSYLLPFGTVEVTFDPTSLQWGDRQLVDLTPVAELEVHGLRQRYRWPGIGAPLAASTEPLDPNKFNSLISDEAKVPLTAVLRMPDARRDLDTGSVHGTLEVYAANNASAIDIDGQLVPLEVETTSALAYSLAESRMWDWEIQGFLFGDLLAKEPSKLNSYEPYRKGRFPVVLVHGTASSPGRWAEMVNDLSNDSRIRECFQFWYFFYDTGNPIAYSAATLRESLRAAVETLDPGGTDPTLRDMVVVGHSQGGLLTKMTVVDTGTQMYDQIFTKPVDELIVSDKTRTFLKKVLFVTPLPFVGRVIFVATPHHGSYVAGSWIAQYVASFASLPQDLMTTTGELITGNPGAVMFTSVNDIQGSVRNMTPGNRFVQSLAALPMDPAVTAHSIIAVDGEGPPEGLDDGVVEYQSAHIDGVESELVVRSTHSVQGNPHAIEEVRRILLEHAEDARRRGIACGDLPNTTEQGGGTP
ncbi:MAG: esterase/lipase family protein [Candidatus Binatia bacterium]